MPALYLVEFALFAAFFYGLVTQVAMPLWRDTPLFPMFDKESRLESKLQDAKQSVLEAELEREIKRHSIEAETIRKSIKGKEGTE